MSCLYTVNAIYASVILASTRNTFGTEKASDYGPGFLGFVFTAVMVVAGIFLMRDMVRRVRRVRYQSEAELRQHQMMEDGEKRKLEEPDEPIDPKTSEEK
ncbi:hypothetical protein [Glutamicibacter protophormiae]|uniref:Uncharacterized protein n=1 Tax=Glutamicibacter protophormiae TaxID=37930 RepID=A0ABS4XQ83_GLUPR|nr:hypothetical protein [Glutamicibacter protophormiae]MBP2398674.1 hypothetical protein [Glutamicibacter protophormiae]GGL81508.1 hypothetical protein GCM10010038_09400 [Glutamicibacter protophormiae]